MKKNKEHPIDSIKRIYAKDPVLVLSFFALLFVILVISKNQSVESEGGKKIQDLQYQSNAIPPELNKVPKRYVGETFVFSRTLTDSNGITMEKGQDIYEVKSVTKDQVRFLVTRKMGRTQETMGVLTTRIPVFPELRYKTVGRLIERKPVSMDKDIFPISKGETFHASFSETIDADSRLQIFPTRCRLGNLSTYKMTKHKEISTAEFKCHYRGGIDYYFYNARLGYWVTRSRRISLGPNVFNEEMELLSYSRPQRVL